MLKKNTDPPKRWRTKEAAAIARAVQAAGGTVELTGKGHLKITGPAGLAIVGSDPGSNRLATAIRTIERNTGLTLGTVT